MSAYVRICQCPRPKAQGPRLRCIRFCAQAVAGLNLVIIDASGIANFDVKHSLWPTWHKLSQKLTDEVGDANTGLNIEATNVNEIDEAFEKVAGAMAGGGAAG